MANYQLLNTKEHARLRLVSGVEKHSHFAPIVVNEIISAAATCPIMFAKDPTTGEFLLVAIFNLKAGEPPLKSLEERGGFLPLSWLCKGFAISGQEIAIDRDSVRFSELQGEPLFTATQQPADNLREIQQALGQYVQGTETTKQFIQSLLALNLIEPIEINLAFENQESLSLKGLYTLSLDAIKDLDDSSATTLFRSGYLEWAYLIAASRKQLTVLAQLYNRVMRHPIGVAS